MIGAEKLTDAGGRTAAQLKTVPGMASWGGEGPRDTTCRQCQHWTQPKKLWERWFSVGHERAGGLRPQRCEKAQRLMNRSDTPKVEHWNASCKFFVLNAEAPPVSRPHD